MRNEIIGSYSWDTSASDVNSGEGENEWPQADLMKLLNPGYDSETVGGSLYYNSKSGTCYNGQTNATTSCNFTSSGIKNKDTKNKIAEATWNLGGWNNNEIYSNQFYSYERGTTVYSGHSTTWIGKVALLYPSDYGYAVDFNSCSKTLYDYDDSTCTSNNWIKKIITNSGLNYGWLLTPYSGASGFAWVVCASGYVFRYSNDGVVSLARGVVPTLYLSSNEIIESGDGGDGSISNPYKLG